jgi:hypothetical protein
VRAFHLLLAGSVLYGAAGCSQIRQVPTQDAFRAREVKDATVRTRTGETYFFEHADVASDTLRGYALEKRTVYLEGGEVQEVTEARRVELALSDVEQLSLKRRNWKKAGLWAIATAGAAGIVAVVSSQNSGGTPTGGGSGGGKGGGPGN